MTAKRFYLDENGINDREYEFGILGEDELVDIINGIVDENEQLKQQMQKTHKLINSKIQSARELGSVRTVIVLKNLQRELNGDIE